MLSAAGRASQSPYFRAAAPADASDPSARRSEALRPGQCTALTANRLLHPDGTLNSYAERYLKERVFKLFAQSIRRRAKGAA